MTHLSQTKMNEKRPFQQPQLQHTHSELWSYSLTALDIKWGNS